MTLCPYKWALYIGSMMALLWCALALWMEWQSPAAPTADDATADGGWEARARAKAAALAAADDADGSDSDSDDEAAAGLVAVR